jgi:alpha-beta hydrolase superfamily lysophospholipase
MRTQRDSILNVRSVMFAAMAVAMVVLSIIMLKRDRRGITMTDIAVGKTPIILFFAPNSTGPIVVIAHDFAGSSQMMNAYALPIAQAGYRVMSFDFQGHGRNPVPMSGDVIAIDSTTALLVAEARAVIAAARDLPDAGAVSVLGHSMATDVLIRASATEQAAGTPLAAVIPIPMFSAAVTPQF